MSEMDSQDYGPVDIPPDELEDTELDLPADAVAGLEATENDEAEKLLREMMDNGSNLLRGQASERSHRITGQADGTPAI